MAPSGDYRIFVGAFPTGELAARIQALRQAHDPKTARITAPHVTLAGTYWRRGPATPANEADTLARLQTQQSELAPFTLTLGGVDHFSHYGVIYLAVQPTAALLAVRRTLLSVLEPDKHRHFTPHLTLTMRLKRAAGRALFETLRQSEWHRARWAAPIDQLWLMQRGPRDPAWRAIGAIELGAADVKDDKLTS